MGKFFLLVTLSSVVPAASCKPRRDSSELQGRIESDPSKFGLMQIIDRSEFKICLIYPNGMNNDSPITEVVAKVKDDVVYSFDEWLLHLSDFLNKSFKKKIIFLGVEHGCKPQGDGDQFNQSEGLSGPNVEAFEEANRDIADLSILIHPGVIVPSVTRHKAGMQWLRIMGDEPRTVILHEVGHTLGLYDAYESYVDHPVSIMNKEAGMTASRELLPHSNGHLYPDDIYSLKQAFCALHHLSAPKKCASLPYHHFIDSNYPRLGKKGKPAFKLDVVVKEAECLVPSVTKNVLSKMLEVTAVTPGSGADKAGIRPGDFIFMLNGFPKSVEELNHLVLTSDRQTVPVGFRRRNSRGICDIVMQEKVTLEINDEPLPTIPAAKIAQVKPNSKLGVGDVVRTLQNITLKGIGKHIPENVFLTVLDVNGSDIYVKYFGEAGWIQIHAVVHAPLGL